jgi:hypothetical protein
VSGSASAADVPSPQSTGRFTFELTERVPLGSPDSFLAWANDKFHAGIPPVSTLAAQAPGPLKAAVEQLLHARITIDTLTIETGPDAHWQFAASVDFPAPLQIGSFLELDRIGFHIQKSKAADAPAS